MSEDKINVYFRGIGGARVDAIMQDLPHTLPRYRPHIVFIHIGGNDIVNDDDDMDYLAHKVLQVARTLQLQYGVQQVIISQLLRRRRARCVRYNDLVVTFNVSLAAKIKQSGYSGIVLWKHKGFWAPDDWAQVQHRDGVHLNATGQFKYYRSCRDALITALKRLHTSCS